MSTNVKYWNIDEHNKRKLVKWICFSEFRYDRNPIPHKLRYICSIYKSLEENEVEFYLNFLNRILNKELFTFKKLTIKSKKYVTFELSGKNMGRWEFLMYLTAFRYLDEYPAIVKELYNNKKIESDTELFEKFQDLHFDFSMGKITQDNGQNNLAGHGLLYPYGEKFTPISLHTFRENIKMGKSGVHSFFDGKRIIRNITTNK